MFFIFQIVINEHLSYTPFFQTLKTLSNSIDKLKTELSTGGIGLKLEIGGQPVTGVTVKSPEQAKKEILDMELELMTKPSTGEETLELKKKLNELTKVVRRFNTLCGKGTPLRFFF
jgi:RNA-binding protein 26